MVRTRSAIHQKHHTRLINIAEMSREAMLFLVIKILLNLKPLVIWKRKTINVFYGHCIQCLIIVSFFISIDYTMQFPNIPTVLNTVDQFYIGNFPLTDNGVDEIEIWGRDVTP